MRERLKLLFLQKVTGASFALLSFYLLVLSIPLQYRYYKMFKSLSEAISGPGRELPCFFEKIIFFCISDLLILSMLAVLCLKRKIDWKAFFWRGAAKYLSLFFLASLISIILSDDSRYALQYIRWFQLVWVGMLFYVLSTDVLGDRNKLLKAACICLVAVSLFESFVATLQYFTQHYVGLKQLGEINFTSPFVKPATFGMSDGSLWIFDRIFSIDRGKNDVIRAYGTLPHPNILGGFMALSLLSTYFLFCRALERRKVFLFTAVLFCQLFALVITYSRAGLYGWILGSMGWFALMCIRNWKRKGQESPHFLLEKRRSKQLFLTLAAISCVCLTLFYPQILERGGVVSYTETTKVADEERLLLQDIATNIVEQNPLVGVGFNSYMLKMKEYSQVPLQYFQLHPVHNIFLLVAAEVGAVGLLFLLPFLFSSVRNLLMRGLTLEVIALSSLLLCLTFIGCCDFYLLEDQQGRLLFFAILGFAALFGKKETSQESSAAALYSA